MRCYAKFQYANDLYFDRLIDIENDKKQEMKSRNLMTIQLNIEKIISIFLGLKRGLESE